MRRTGATLLAVLAVLGGCGSPSTLSEDDQAFCAEQEEEPLAYLRDEVDTMLKDDGHWASEGDAFAFQSVVLERSRASLQRNLQDERLSKLVSTLEDSLFDASLAADTGEYMDVDVLQQLKTDLRAVEDFCGDEA